MDSWFCRLRCVARTRAVAVLRSIPAPGTFRLGKPDHRCVCVSSPNLPCVGWATASISASPSAAASERLSIGGRPERLCNGERKQRFCVSRAKRVGFRLGVRHAAPVKLGIGIRAR